MDQPHKREAASVDEMDHVAGVENLIVAMATYEAACWQWPGETITLRQGSRVIEDSRKRRVGLSFLGDSGLREGLTHQARPRGRAWNACRAV